MRQLLNHTSGLPDYTQSDGFRQQFEDDPGGFVSPQKIISWVQNAGLVFPAGSRYKYSNTDNIVLGLLAQKVTGKSYGAPTAGDRLRAAEPQADKLPLEPAPAAPVHPRLRGSATPGRART